MGIFQNPPPGSLNWGLDIKHGLKQEPYLLHKASLLKPLVSKIDHPLSRVRVRTIRHPHFTKWASVVVPVGKKIIPPELISQVDLLALAIWHMDDRSLLKRARKNGSEHRLIRIASFSFTKQENEALIEMLQTRFHLEARLWKQASHHAKGDFYWGIKISGSHADTFLSLTRPYAETSCMSYKWA